MTFEEYGRLVIEAQALAVRGWDFSAIDGRWVEYETSWYYRDLVIEALASANSLLDMGVGVAGF